MQRVVAGVSKVGWPSSLLGSAARFDSEYGQWIANAGSGNVVLPSNAVRGAPYGTVLAAEADPVNLADVPVARRLIIQPTKAGLVTSQAVVSLKGAAYGGAGLFAFSIWIYEACAKRWLSFGSAVAGTVPASGYLSLQATTYPIGYWGALIYVSVNNNTAGAQYMGVLLQ